MTQCLVTKPFEPSTLAAKLMLHLVLMSLDGVILRSPITERTLGLSIREEEFGKCCFYGLSEWGMCMEKRKYPYTVLMSSRHNSLNNYFQFTLKNSNAQQEKGVRRKCRVHYRTWFKENCVGVVFVYAGCGEIHAWVYMSFRIASQLLNPLSVNVGK